MTRARDGRVLDIQRLARPWFERTQYRPRVEAGVEPTWFPLTAAFSPEPRVPDAIPPEPAGGREALAQAFRQTYEGWGLPVTADTERSLDVLGKEGTAVIVAGQQPGFLGGPLLTLYKALSAVAASHAYRGLTGRHCVPVFWVASEDHDIDEVRDAHFPGSEPAGTTFRYPHAGDRRPLSDYPMDEAACEVLDQVARELEPRRHGVQARELVDLYRGRSFAGGFAAVLASLLGHTGLLVIDPTRLRASASGLIRRVLEHPETALACVERGRRDVRLRGMEPLVAGRFPLFLVVEGKRHHLALTADGLGIDGGGPQFARGELVRRLATDPGSFSAGALLRPLVERVVLPSILTIGGPAEVGYFAQLGPLAELLEVPPPKIGLRLQATLVDGKLARTVSAVSLDALVRATAPEDLVSPGDEPPGSRAARAWVREAVAVLDRACGEVSSPQEQERLRAQTRKIQDGLQRFLENLDRTHSRQETQQMEATTRLFDFVFPRGTLQERWWSTLHFVAKHGTGWIDELLDDLSSTNPLEVVHRWVTFLPQDEG